jgi:hypothetical protein
MSKKRHCSADNCARPCSHRRANRATADASEVAKARKCTYGRPAAAARANTDDVLLAQTDGSDRIDSTTAATPNTTSRCVVAGLPATAAADDRRLHGEQLPRIGHATKRTLYGCDNLPA